MVTGSSLEISGLEISDVEILMVTGSGLEISGLEISCVEISVQ